MNVKRAFTTLVLKSASSVLAMFMMTTAANASLGKCVLRVDGHTYIHGPCEIDIEQGGDFKISSPQDTRMFFYFAYVYLDPSSSGIATGAWNDKDAESHAGDDLGTLTRKGACWSNARATVCAYAK